jgi:hypothetical protein
VCTRGIGARPACWLQVVNYNHMMPTRYTLDVDLKGVVTPEVVDDSSKRLDANKVRWLACGRAAGAHTLLRHSVVLVVVVVMSVCGVTPACVRAAAWRSLRSAATSAACAVAWGARHATLLQH